MIQINGEQYRLVGVLEHGRRLVTDRGDYILRPLLRCDGAGVSVVAPFFPDDHEPTEIRPKDFFPWKRIELTDEDMPEIRRLTADHKMIMLRHYEEREAASLVLGTKCDFIRRFGPREGEPEWSDVETRGRWMEWIRNEQRSFQDLRKRYEDRDDFGELTGPYDEDAWVDERGDDLRYAKWQVDNKEETARLLDDESFGLRFQVANVMGLDIASNAGFEDANRFLDRIRYEVVYLCGSVYLEGFEAATRSLDSIKLIEHAAASVEPPKKLEGEPISPKAMAQHRAHQYRIERLGDSYEITYRGELFVAKASTGMAYIVAYIRCHREGKDVRPLALYVEALGSIYESEPMEDAEDLAGNDQTRSNWNQDREQARRNADEGIKKWRCLQELEARESKLDVADALELDHLRKEIGDSDKFLKYIVGQQAKAEGRGGSRHDEERKKRETMLRAINRTLKRIREPAVPSVAATAQKAAREFEKHIRRYLVLGNLKFYDPPPGVNWILPH